MQEIKDIRSRTGLSQAQFASLLKLPKRSLQNWEEGIRKCPEYLLELIEYRIDHDDTFGKEK